MRGLKKKKSDYNLKMSVLNRNVDKRNSKDSSKSFESSKSEIRSAKNRKLRLLNVLLRTSKS